MQSYLRVTLHYEHMITCEEMDQLKLHNGYIALLLLIIDYRQFKGPSMVNLRWNSTILISNKGNNDYP